MIETIVETTLQQNIVRNKSRIVLKPLNTNLKNRLKEKIVSSTKKQNEGTNICSTSANEFPPLKKRKIVQSARKFKLPKVKINNNLKTIKDIENEDNEKIYTIRNVEQIEYIKIDKEKEIKEKEKINKIRNLMFKRQNYMRIKNKSFDEDEDEEEKNNNEKINQFLEDMCVYGNIIEKEIEENQSKNQDKYIEIEDALKMKDKDTNLFCLALLANNLNSIGIKTVIENSENDEKIPGYEDIMAEEKEEEALTCLQFITSGYLYKTKYILHFDFGEEENEELLSNIEKYDEFKNNLKKKLSKDLDTHTDKIIVTYPQRGSFEVQVIFQSDEFNNLNLNSFIKI